MYEQSRLMTKAGQKAKQGAASASQWSPSASTQSVGGKQNMGTTWKYVEGVPTGV